MKAVLTLMNYLENFKKQAELIETDIEVLQSYIDEINTSIKNIKEFIKN